MIITVSNDAGQTLKEYDLKKEISLEKHLDTLCSQLGIKSGEHLKYALFVMTTRMYISQESLSNEHFNLPAGSAVQLKLKPDINAESCIQKMSGPDSAEAKQQILIYLKQQFSQDKAFSTHFLEKNGMKALTAVISQSNQKNQLSFALQVLEKAMAFHIGWERLDEEFTTTIVNYLASPNLSASSKAIEIITYLAESTNHGFPAINKAIIKQAQLENKKPYETLIHLLESGELNNKLASLKLIRVLMDDIKSDSEKKGFIKVLDDLGINNVLQQQLKILSTVANAQSELYYYQYARLWEIRANSKVQYDKDNKDHEQSLMKLWQIVFPDTKLDARVSNLWKKMGFQGKDPATDFRGMGLLGLKNLIYIAETQTKTFRNFLEKQSKKENGYPVAVAGINLTRMLHDLLNIAKEDPNRRIFNILFDHPHAFEEMYCISFSVLDSTWEKEKATYMDFPRILAIVTKDITGLLSQPSCETIEGFKTGATQKGMGGEVDNVHKPFGGGGSGIGGFSNATARGGEDPKNMLRNAVRQNIAELVKNQKLSYLRDGAVFRVYNKATSAGKASVKQCLQFNYYKLVESGKELKWAPCPAGDENAIPMELPNTINLQDCKTVVVGAACPMHASKAKKTKTEDDELIPLSFSLMLANDSIDFVAASKGELNNWADGLRGWLGMKMETWSQEANDDFKTLVDTDLEVKFLDLEGIQLPTSMPVVPNPPANYDFYYGDQEEMTNQGYSSTSGNSTSGASGNTSLSASKRRPKISLGVSRRRGTDTQGDD